MALSSTTYAVRKADSVKARVKKRGLLTKHKIEMQKVLAEAKTFSDDRKGKLETISDEGLRETASR
jgi:hypothetical protein